jgi:uncharacterized protein YlxW (UPF0749 family)
MRILTKLPNLVHFSKLKKKVVYSNPDLAEPVIVMQEKEAREETSQLLADQTRLQRLHEQLQQDYDNLRQEREDLKTSERGLRLEISKLR